MEFNTQLCVLEYNVEQCCVKECETVEWKSFESWAQCWIENWVRKLIFFLDESWFA